MPSLVADCRRSVGLQCARKYDDDDEDDVQSRSRSSSSFARRRKSPSSSCRRSGRGSDEWE